MSFEDIAQRMQARRKQEDPGFALPFSSLAKPPSPIDTAFPSVVAVAAPRTLRHAVGTSITQLVVLTALGVIATYAVALVVVGTGIGGVHAFIGIPALLVIGLAWAWSSHTIRIDRFAGLATSTLLGGVLLLAAGLPTLRLTTESTSDASVKDGVISLTIQTAARMTEMPGLEQVFSLSALIACAALAGATLLRLLKR